MADDDEAVAREMFFRAIELAKAGDNAAALPLFYQLLEMPGVPAKAFDSCIANVAICSHRLGDHATALTYTAMFLDSSATPPPEERLSLLEMFFASYKGQMGIAFHNPYNEYD